MNTESKFAIYTSFYKSERYIDQIYENLMSIKYSNWTWFVTDDFSPDNTKSKLLNKIQGNNKIVYLDQQYKKQMYWKPNSMIPSEYEYILLIDSDDLVDVNILTVYNHLAKKYPDVNFLSCDYKKMNESDNQVHSVGFVRNDDVLYKKLEHFHPTVDYLNNLNYYCLGLGRCFKNLKELDFEIKDFDACAEDSYHTMYSNGFGKWLHVPRNLYRWSYRTDSESHSVIKDNFNGNFDVGYDKCKNNPYEPIYDFNDCYKEFNSMIYFDINELNKNVCIISPRLSKDQQDKIRNVYIDKHIEFNKYSGFEQYAIVLNYFESEDSFFSLLSQLKTYNKKMHIVLYYLNENIHPNISSRDTFLNQKLNKFKSNISTYFPYFSHYSYFRHLIFTIKHEV